MNDHIGDTNEMSDTPISDSTAHNIADLGMLCRTLERLAAVRLDYIKQLETDIERLTQKVSKLYEGAEEQKQRIKRLEEAGDALANNHNPFTFIDWQRAKEDKP
jgi:septal ring factor EnvC (AmiA/AmiB activator)